MRGFRHGRHVICEGKNYFCYQNPETTLWSIHPWDIDLTWADNMYKDSCGGIDEFKNRIANRPALNLEFKNRVREIRDLLFNTDQAYQLIDEYAAMIDDPNGGPAFVDVDRTLWDFNPILVSSKVLSYKAGHGRFYQIAPTKDFPGLVQLMKDYLVKRAVLLDNAASDPLIPATPTITYAGPVGYAANRLSFRASNYRGTDPFAAIKWRIGETTPPGRPAFDPAAPRQYEIETAWESVEITKLETEMQFPPQAVEVGHTYRVRAKVRDSAGRWSHWSDAIQFAAGAPDNTAALLENLRLTELMYHPPDGNEFEFVELHNLSANAALDLTGVAFSRGIDFTFPSGATLQPGGYLLVVPSTAANNFGAFRAKYRLDAKVPIFGPYLEGLANEGERLTIQATGGGADLIDFTYDDAGAWPTGTDGGGYSLVVVESALSNRTPGALNDPQNWRASRSIGGSPGGPELPVATSDSDGDGMPDDWEIS